jgi:mRNA degradation ribonuclease J1/J2
MVEASREVLSKAFIGNALNGSSRELSNTVKDLLNKFYARETKRRPLILPVTLEV